MIPTAKIMNPFVVARKSHGINSGAINLLVWVDFYLSAGRPDALGKKLVAVKDKILDEESVYGEISNMSNIIQPADFSKMQSGSKRALSIKS
jgi:hypothetical protein